MYPDISSVAYGNPVRVRQEYKTLASSYAGVGQEQYRQLWLYPRRTIQLTYPKLSLSGANTLYEHHVSMRGRALPFNFFFPTPAAYKDEYVGTCDGSTLVYNMPCKNGEGIDIYVGSSKLTADTNYTIAAGAGADGADRLTLTAPGAAGEHITCDFTGRLKVRCHYESDALDWETFYQRLTTMGITLKGGLNA